MSVQFFVEMIPQQKNGLIGENMKLFEIPVYAVSREELDKRVRKAYEKHKNGHSHFGLSERELKRTFDLTAFPSRLWEYNHIVGFIVVSKKRADVILEYYAPLPGIQKYYWNSRIKHFVQNAQINGYHFYTGDINSGAELRENLKVLLRSYLHELKNRGYWADLEAFNNIDSLLDYDRLLKEHGGTE